MNGFKIAALMTALVVLFMSVGGWVGGLLGGLAGGKAGMVLAFIVACGLNFAAYRRSDGIVLRMYRAREITTTDHPEYFESVVRVSRAAELPMPRVYIVPTRTPNAFATGRSPEHSAIAVTEGLLEILRGDELDGVIGHELAHIKQRDMLVGTIVAAVAGVIGYIVSLARLGAVLGGMGAGDEKDAGGLGNAYAALFAPVIAVLIQTAISRKREFKADAEGARMSGTPGGLADALEKLHKAPYRHGLNLDRRPATAHLMIANPLSGQGLSTIFSTHPKVEDRVKRLREMAAH